MELDQSIIETLDFLIIHSFLILFPRHYIRWMIITKTFEHSQRIEYIFNEFNVVIRP